MGAVRDEVLSFEVDEEPGLPLGFRDRLAQENGWSRRHADRVYDEYRRFLWLAVSGDRPVTPSDAVDQAWHLHLTYTRSYWDRLCGTVLERPLHHGPTGGTAADDARYREQYRSTLERYRAEFGVEPPAAIWPSVEERFRPADRWVRVDTASHVVLRRAPLVATGIGGAAVLAGTGAASDSDAGVIAAVAVVAVIGVVIVALIVAVMRNGSGGGRRRGGWGGDAGAGAWWGGASSHDSGSHHDSGGGGWFGGWGGGDSGGGHDSGGVGSGDGGGGGGGCGGGGCGGGGGGD